MPDLTPDQRAAAAVPDSFPHCRDELRARVAAVIREAEQAAAERMRERIAARLGEAAEGNEETGRRIALLAEWVRNLPLP